MTNSEDTQQFSAAEVAQLKRYAKRSTPVQPKTPSSTNRVHLAIVIAVGLVAIAILGLIAWYLYLAAFTGGEYHSSADFRSMSEIQKPVLERGRN